MRRRNVHYSCYSWPIHAVSIHYALRNHVIIHSYGTNRFIGLRPDPRAQIMKRDWSFVAGYTLQAGNASVFLKVQDTI